MAGTALATFLLLVTFLQVRADVDCYAIAGCPAADTDKYTATTARECCINGLPGTRSFSTVGNATDCAECIVIGFSKVDVTLEENLEKKEIIKVKPLTTASGAVINSVVDFNVEVYPSEATAKLGSDLKVNDGATLPLIFSRRLSLLDDNVTLQTLNDDDTGEIEHFRLEVEELQIFNRDTLRILPAFAGDPLIVTIIDDDIIQVEFGAEEFILNEDGENLTVTFNINNPIPAATHFVVRPMTYKDYDDAYPSLLAKYPDIKPNSKNDEYDQAESEDFDPTEIHFTIPTNTVNTNRTVIVKVKNDELLEPAAEGFRLVLELAGTTRPSEVKFGRQIALCRIDNTDRIKFGFANTTLSITDMIGTFHRNLSLRIISGKTEIPFNLTFASGARTTATVGQDYEDFSASRRYISPPDTFLPVSSLSLAVNGDDVYEGDELIEVNLEYVLDLPQPFKPKHIDESSGYNSVVVPPTESIEVDNRTVLVTIVEGGPIPTAKLSVPKMVPEGKSFHPSITVSSKVNAIFRVFSPVGEGTADGTDDFSFMEENVVIDPTNNTKVTSSSVATKTDNLVEPDETIVVQFEATSSPGITIDNPKETVTIIDQDSATIGFEITMLDVYEDMSPATLNVVVKTGSPLADNAEAVVRFYTMPDTADEVDDFAAVNKTLTFTGAQQMIAVEIRISDDAPYELPETFQAHLQLVSTNANISVDPTPATVTIHDEAPPTEECTLSSSLMLDTFRSVTENGTKVNISMGCERKLVTSCDSDIELEIRVDFFQGNFASTKAVIFYEGEEVIIDEYLALTPSTPTAPSPFEYSTGMTMLFTSVKIPEIELTVTRNSTHLTISTDNTTLELAGLCGNLQGELVYPNCEDKVAMGEPLDDFIHSYKVKPSDQVLRGERKECGITTNDTIVSDPLMTVPIHVDGFGSDLNLCYEIHGAADKYFNLVSDECTSVNAHYAKAAEGSDLNIIDSISVVAVDNTGTCRNITIDASSELCAPEVTKKRRRRSPTYILNENGVSVRHYDTRARISVPNCEDNELVMWVVCQNQSLFDHDLGVMIGPVQMLKFEIARGLNLKETSHGLLGQFWNIPITVKPYTGPFVYPTQPDDVAYTVEVHYPELPVRSFVGFKYNVTWEWKHKECVYAGDRQGGPAGEVANDGSVIAGNYEDYVITYKFGTQYKYGVFKEGACN